MERHGLGDGSGAEFQDTVVTGQSDDRHRCRRPSGGEPALHHVSVSAIGFQICEGFIDGGLEGDIFDLNRKSVFVTHQQLGQNHESLILCRNVFQDRQIINGRISLIAFNGNGAIQHVAVILDFRIGKSL